MFVLRENQCLAERTCLSWFLLMSLKVPLTHPIHQQTLGPGQYSNDLN